MPSVISMPLENVQDVVAVPETTTKTDRRHHHLHRDKLGTDFQHSQFYDRRLLIGLGTLNFPYSEQWATEHVRFTDDWNAFSLGCSLPECHTYLSTKLVYLLGKQLIRLEFRAL